jgi:hypothetical protein
MVFLKEPINRIVFMSVDDILFNYDALIKVMHIF